MSEIVLVQNAILNTPTTYPTGELLEYREWDNELNPTNIAGAEKNGLALRDTN